MTDHENHCRRPGCTCGHVVCFRGWIDNEAKHETTPCETCRPDTHRRWLRREQARAKGYPLEALGRIMQAKVNA